MSERHSTNASDGGVANKLIVAATTLLFSLLLVPMSLRDAGLRYDDALFIKIDHAYRNYCISIIALLVIAAWIVRGARWLRSQPPVDVPAEWQADGPSVKAETPNGPLGER